MLSHSSQSLSVLVLSGLLSLGSGGLSRPATAAPVQVPSSLQLAQAQNRSTNFQTLFVTLAVRRDVSRRTGIPLGQLQVVSAERRTWPDRCLGLPRPDELCAQALTPGWRIQISDGQQVWTYHTDIRGQNFRLATSNGPAETNLPQSIANTVLRDVSRRTGLPRSSFDIVEAERQTWPDGCLGLAKPDEFCTQALVSGWRVVVTDGRREWIYRTGGTSQPIQVRLERGSTGTGSLQPTRIPASELPEPLPDNAVFRVITSGGFAGRSEQITLLANGRLVRAQLNVSGTTSRSQTIARLSRQQVRQFQQVLQQQQFACFDRQNYPAPRGAADYITVTLISDTGVVRYADIVEDQLPDALQEVIEAWEDLSD